jgi:hypothetical protein
MPEPTPPVIPGTLKNKSKAGVELIKIIDCFRLNQMSLRNNDSTVAAKLFSGMVHWGTCSCLKIVKSMLQCLTSTGKRAEIDRRAGNR